MYCSQPPHAAEAEARQTGDVRHRGRVPGAGGGRPPLLQPGHQPPLQVRRAVTRPGITEAWRRYHSSILYIRRNILTYLSMLLVLSMNITSNATVTSAPYQQCPEVCLQNAGVLYRLTLGPQPALLARLTNCGLYLGFYMFLATNCCITVFRTPSPVSSV